MKTMLLKFGQRVGIGSIARSADFPAKGFFDNYPLFYSSSMVGATPNRLNQRHRALIAANEAIISGKTVLDIASHDGRWSFAGLAIGAKRICGIEAREHLVTSAEQTLRAYGVTKDRFRFVRGDIFDEIDKVEPGSIDTVFCFGIFYHTLHHMLLLSKIAQLKPRHLIIDTDIHLHPGAWIYVRTESTEPDSNVAMAGAKQALVGAPTQGALELMLANFGWTPHYYDWRRAGITRWEDLEDYHEGRRVSLVVNCEDICR